MRYFLDTEFIESGPGKPIQLISIGIVNEKSETYYAISSEFKEADANDWVKENVLPKLNKTGRLTLKEIAVGIINFIGDDQKPEFWGYYSDYDWVVFCQIFGTMIGLPKNFPMYCKDIKQLCDDLGNPKLPSQKATDEHNALMDAIWNKEAWDFLESEI